MDQELRDPTIVVHGDVSPDMVAYAREKVLAVATHTSAPVLRVEIRLEHHPDRARDRPDHVEITIDLDGTPVRARRNAPTMREAIDQAISRLHRRVEVAKERPQARRLRHRDIGSWHHGDEPTERHHTHPRPVEDRMLVRRKTFALAAESIEEALYDLETLDHDFFLFLHDESDAEAVVSRVPDGYALAQRVATPEAITRVGVPLQIGPHPPLLAVEKALNILDESAAPFLFFIDTVSGRGVVAYRRYDGDYGLIVPS
jgi:ribosomal subunit interface protein